ncbi:hypothetical protein DER45DRAFT_618923 [Fusarium avenaceum]|nr:hypothetical protein DER45DRAFT_618923 [Fusarium avenaceum]
MPEHIPTESLATSHRADSSAPVHKLQQEYRETIQAASDKLRECIRNVKVDIFRAKLAEYKETLGRIGNIYRYSVENGLTGRETAQECLDTLVATATRSHHVDDAAIERLVHNVREHAFCETLRQYVLTNVDIEGYKELIKQLEAKPIRHDANEAVAKIYAQEDVLISAIEMVAKVGKEGVITLMQRFHDFFVALENKVQQTWL